MSNPMRKLQKFTERICLNFCLVEEKDKVHRCCDALFCGLTARDLPPGKYLPTGHEISYMGPKGCVIKAEDRPFCSAFLCPGIKTLHPKVWKEYEKLCAKAGVPPVRT